MKIGISCFPSIGGSGILATMLAIGMAERGHQVHFINYQRPALLNKQLANIYFHSIEVMPYQSFKYLPYDTALLSAMLSLMKHIDLDIFHAHYIVPHATSAYFAKLASKSQRTKIIATMHGTDVFLLAKDPSYQDVIKYVLEQVNGVTAVSNFLKNLCINTLKLSRNIKTIYDFVDTDYFKPDKDHKFRLTLAKPEEKIILHVSNARSIKRVSDLIRAFAKIQKKIPSQLVLVGDGPETRQLKIEASELKLTDKIKFIGASIQVAALYNAADVFVLPSEVEGFGMAALEAMSCGVPCVVTQCGGTKELVREGIDGLFIESGNIKDIEDKILTLLMNEPLRLTMGKQAREGAIERFEKNQILEQYLQFYQEL